eukprot:scaffold73012_cov17-Tisochrysis_lutea.AAC.2
MREYPVPATWSRLLDVAIQSKVILNTSPFCGTAWVLVSAPYGGTALVPVCIPEMAQLGCLPMRHRAT